MLCLGISFAIFSQKKTYDIGILLDKRTEELDPLLGLLLQDQIKAVVGEDATINFPASNVLTNNFNLAKAEENYNLLLTNEVDIILAFGAVNNKVLSKQTIHKKPTILFGAVNKDFNGIDLSKKNSGIENFTYLIESESFLEDFKTFKELTKFKTLGIAIEKPLVELLPLKETFDKEFKILEANYKLIPFESSSDISSNLDGIDAIYMAGGFFLNKKEITSLAQTFIEKKLPSFTSLSVDQVRSGIMATNQSDENLNQFFRRIALSIEAYINGTPLSELPVYIDYVNRLTINYNTAEAVGVPIKYSLIAETDFVGDYVNVLSKKQYSLLEVIEGVLNKNLSLQATKKDIELSQQNVKTAKSNYLPNLTASSSGTYVDSETAEASAGQNPEFSTGGNINLSQTVFSEAANANISVQENLEKAQQENYNAAELDAIFDASNAYFTALILKANAQIQMRNLSLTKRNLQIAEQNFDAGQAGRSDLLRFRSEMAQNTQAMVEAVNELEKGFINLNQLLNNKVNEEIDIEDVDLDKGIFNKYNYERLTELLDDPALREPFIDYLINRAQDNAPELKSLGFNLKATERNIKLNSAGRFLPTVALQGQYNRTFSRSGAGSTFPQGVTPLDDNYNVGLNVSIPIFNQNLTNINRQTAVIQKEQLEINTKNTELAIATNVRNGVLNLVNELTNIELSRVSESTAKEALDLTRTSYSSGAVNIVQLLDAQNNHLNAQLASTNATYNYLITSLLLERYIGHYFLLNSEEENNKFRQQFLEYLSNRN